MHVHPSVLFCLFASSSVSISQKVNITNYIIRDKLLFALGIKPEGPEPFELIDT